MRPAAEAAVFGAGAARGRAPPRRRYGGPGCLARRRFAGYGLCDPPGRRIGRVSKVFVDAAAGSPAHGEVALGLSGRRNVPVPVGGREVNEALRTLVLERGQRA